MSDLSYNAAIYDDDGRLSGSVYLFGQGPLSTQDGPSYFVRDPYHSLGAYLSYQLTPEISLTATGTNLTNNYQTFGEIGQEADGVNRYRLNRVLEIGRTFTLGVRAKL